MVKDVVLTSYEAAQSLSMWTKLLVEMLLMSREVHPEVVLKVNIVNNNTSTSAHNLTGASCKRTEVRLKHAEILFQRGFHRQH